MRWWKSLNLRYWVYVSGCVDNKGWFVAFYTKVAIFKDQSRWWFFRLGFWVSMGDFLKIRAKLFSAQYQDQNLLRSRYFFKIGVKTFWSLRRLFTKDQDDFLGRWRFSPSISQLFDSSFLSFSPINSRQDQAAAHFIDQKELQKEKTPTPHTNPPTQIHSLNHIQSL